MPVNPGPPPPMKKTGPKPYWETWRVQSVKRLVKKRQKYFEDMFPGYTVTAENLHVTSRMKCKLITFRKGLALAFGNKPFKYTIGGINISEHTRLERYRWCKKFILMLLAFWMKLVANKL